MQVYLENYLYPSAHHGAQELIEKSLELENCGCWNSFKTMFFLCKIGLDPFQHLRYCKVSPLVRNQIFMYNFFFKENILFLCRIY